MHAILASIGTDGDVFPFIGLGIRLRARGHRVTLATNERYQSLASKHGFAFRALLSDEEMHQLLGNVDVWHPIKSGLVGANWGRHLVEKQYGPLTELMRDEDAVLVAYPPVFAARLLQEKLSRPLVSLAIMPWMVPDVFHPAIAGGFNLPRWAPGIAVRTFWNLLHAVGDVLVGRHVNRMRRSLQLKPIRRVFRWWLSPQCVIGMFPDWYAPGRGDSLPQLRLAGFPLFDRDVDGSVPQDVLDFCRAGPSPVAFTFGTGMMHGARLFRAAADACQLLGRRGILLTRFGDQLPQPLPPFIHHCQYAPFSELFPHCAAVVHHGGFGTTAQALAAGTPQLILPMAFDQPDNAARVKRLGVGEQLNPNSGGVQMAKALGRLITPQTQARCREVAARCGREDAFDVAAQWIEELSSPSVSTTAAHDGGHLADSIG